jgi:hypothetical protein
MALLLAVFQRDCQGSEPPHATHTTLPEPASSGVAHAGALIRTAYYQLRVSAPQDCSPRSHDAPPAGARRIGVEVWLQPTASIQVPANPYYAKLVDSQGSVYEATLGGCGAPLGPTLPARGQPAKGWIVFEVPRTARDFRFTYTPELVGVTKSELTIELSANASSRE